MSNTNLERRWTGAIAATIGVMLGGCGAEPSPGSESDPGGESIGTVEAPMYWEPSPALVTEHVNWHSRDCTQPGGRACTNKGVDFLVFHRNFLKRLRDDYRAQGHPETFARAWTELPSAMKSSANGWTTALQAAENNLMALARPDTSGNMVPFNSMNEFGLYLENNYHNALHGIAARAFGPSTCTSTSDCIVSGVMSPKSTYFFAIHGLVERFYERFTGNSDFNRDGHADLFVRGLDGTNQIRLQNQQTTTSTVTLPSAPVDSCNWYMGATADFNFDGWNDLVWHGPGCSRTRIWYMNGTSRTSTAEMRGVSNSWRLIGAADFSVDSLPDLMWRNPTDGRISVWVMNGANEFLTADVVQNYPVNREIMAIGDFNNDAKADFLFREWNAQAAGYNYFVQYMNGQLFINPPAALGITLNQFQHPVATGRYSRADRWIDVLFRADQPIPSPKPYFHFFMLRGNAGTTLTPHQTTGTDLYVAGP